MVGVRPLLAPTEISDILDCVRQPNFPWTTARHTKFPTTDIERGLDWLDRRAASAALEQPAFSDDRGASGLHVAALPARLVHHQVREAPSAISVRTFGDARRKPRH